MCMTRINNTWRAPRGVLVSFLNMDILTLIRAWPRIQTTNEVWDKMNSIAIHYKPQNGTIGVWEWIINMIIRFIMNSENRNNDREKWYCNLLPVFNIVFHCLMNLAMWTIKQTKKPVSYDNNWSVKSHNFIEESTEHHKAMQFRYKQYSRKCDTRHVYI